MSGHFWMYGIIGEKPQGSQEKYYSFENFRQELDPNAEDYTVHIYSPGGDVFEGLAIYNGLINTGKSIKVLVEGPTASIATLIAGAADQGKLFINKNAPWLIHNPKFDRISGDAEQLRTGADQLDQIKNLLINVYQKRTNLSEEKLWDIINEGKWMPSEMAKELGFVDQVVDSMRAVAYANFKTNIMEDKTPEVLSAIEKLGNRITNTFKELFIKPKNMSDTLADGTVIQVMSEDGDWTGKQITYADGSPVPVGDYPLTDGRLLVVGENSTITEVKAAEDKTGDDMKLKEELEAANAKSLAYETKIKELESALEARNDVAVKAEARAKNLETTVKSDMLKMQAELDKIKNTTVGDQSLPDLGVNKGFNPSASVVNDPMTAFFKNAVLDKRNTD